MQTNYVSIEPGEEVLVRHPTAAEAKQHQISEDEPVFEVTRRSGTVEVHVAAYSIVTSKDRVERLQHLLREAGW